VKPALGEAINIPEGARTGSESASRKWKDSEVWTAFLALDAL